MTVSYLIHPVTPSHVKLLVLGQKKGVNPASVDIITHHQVPFALQVWVKCLGKVGREK